MFVWFESGKEFIKLSVQKLLVHIDSAAEVHGSDREKEFLRTLYIVNSAQLLYVPTTDVSTVELC
jgi:hypothetical protein